MFKNLRTSTKLVLLCSMFVVSILVATYGLVIEKQIAIEFVRRELIGTRYLDALRGVYAAILSEELDPSQIAPADASIKALAAAETDTAGSLNTAKLEQTLMAALQKLRSSRSGDGGTYALGVELLANARKLASRVGDDSKLALDPDLDSYYLQDIVVTKMPELLGQFGELWSLSHTSRPAGVLSSDPLVPPSILDGMVRSTVEGIKRDLTAAYRGEPKGHLREAIDVAMTSMISATDSYLKTVNASNETSDLVLRNRAFASAADSAIEAWTIGGTELSRLLNTRLSSLVSKLRSSLILNGLLAGLSIVLAVITHRNIIRPLEKLESLAENVRETKNYDLRIDYDGQDEIGRLAVAFNAMLAELAAARGREAADQAHTTSMQAELARVARLTTMGEMAASIAHEINQPLTAVVNNANAGLRWLKGQPPNLDEARAAFRRIVDAGGHGSDVIGTIRTMLKKGTQQKTALAINEIIFEVMTLVRGELEINNVSVEAKLADDLPRVFADRIQLQQVILNLIMNAVEAMVSVSDRPRELCIRSEKHEPAGVLVTVEDFGTGIGLEDVDRVFEAFFTRKAEGMGMGLSICRSIVEAHGGRISASRAYPHGSAFQVVLPSDAPSDYS